MLLHAMAEMGHFEGLSLHILNDWMFASDDIDRRLAEAVVCIIQGNRALTHLDVSKSVPFVIHSLA